MSYRHVRRLDPIRTELGAARAAIAYLREHWHELEDRPEMRAVRLAHVREAARRLEATYVIRLFSEFEALLQDHLALRHPGLRIPRTAEALINRVALRERIPDPIRDAAQRVREYRNTIVHSQVGSAPVLSFREVLAALNRYVVRLPDPP